MTRDGWNDRRAYPLLIATETEKAVTRYRADKGLSLGKALNELIRMGLLAAGYMADPSKCQHEWTFRKVWLGEGKVVVCGRCGAKPPQEGYGSLVHELEQPVMPGSGLR